jgi:glutamate racemase
MLPVFICRAVEWWHVHLVITDSGLGGLSICAALERALREGGAGGVRLTYVNAWPFDNRGYNDLPDMAARATVFDGALTWMATLAPDAIVIACNTLSIVYGFTAFSRAPGVSVRGIVDAGVSLFHEALAADPVSAIVLLGTKTTIETGTHRDELIRRGIVPTRIATVSCQGLAGAIEKNPDGPSVAELLDACTSRARDARPPGGTLLIGLCCTHYGYVADRITEALAAKCCRLVRALDPNQRLVGELVTALTGQTAIASAVRTESGLAVSPRPDAGVVAVNVVSKVLISETSRAGITRLIEPVSPATARALRSYAHVPELF